MQVRTSELSKHLEDISRKLQHLTGVTPPAPCFPEVDEAKKGEKEKQIKIDLPASERAREVELQKQRQKEAKKKTLEDKLEQTLKEKHLFHDKEERHARNLPPQEENLPTAKDKPV